MEKTKKIQIKDLNVGMKIKTRAEDGSNVFKTVTSKWNTTVTHEDQIQLGFENGVVVNCSVRHPIMVWSDFGSIIKKLPSELTIEDRVITESGITRLHSAKYEQTNDPIYVDITVEDTHTFFTSNVESGPMVLTHNSQGGIRSASATINYPIWHYQFDDLIVLKNNKGTEETRIRHLDYAVAITAFFYKRLKRNEMITLFDPNEVPDLYEAFYRDTAEFEKLYVHYEAQKGLKTKTISAEVIIREMLLSERADTGRIYLLNVDNVQRQGPYDTKIHPIYQTNLCIEENQLVTVYNVSIGVVKIEIKLIPALCEQHGLTFVESYDEQLGIRAFNLIETAGVTNPDSELIEVEDESGAKLVCTSSHPIFTQNRGYVEAGKLVETDQLLISTNVPFNMINSITPTI